MHTVKETYTARFREKGSKFTGYLFPCESRDGFEAKLQEIKTEFPDATHHCYAWRIDPAEIMEFTQDDGEPGGTAGLPILNELKSAELVNCGLVVVRYYGGTNLGKTGLIEAYGQTAGECIQQARFRKITPAKYVKITYPYEQQNQIDRLKNRFQMEERESTYLKDVTLVMACPVNMSNQLLKRLEQLEHLGIHHESAGRGYIEL